LQLAVLVNLKIVRSQIGDLMSILIQNDDIKLHFIHADAYCKSLFILVYSFNWFGRA